MGGVPPFRHSRSKVRRRRSQLGLDKKTIKACPNCKGPVMPHRTCPTCKTLVKKPRIKKS